MILGIIIGAVAGFVAGVLVGRANRNKVNTIVSDVKSAESQAASVVKKL